MDRQLEELSKEQQDISLGNDDALKLIRFLLYGSREHMMGLKMSDERLKSKISDYVNAGVIKIKNLAADDATSFLVNHFYGLINDDI